uniref:Uncharacterized protein n=1 Tax=Branchiostoma floridae TaxID=7739 RepID=C3ZLH1_BRAFL|eukprot:XP_002590597.1 hypothetical protein BRAFLDRAFT_83763 [Branchiostoma floridae]
MAIVSSPHSFTSTSDRPEPQGSTPRFSLPVLLGSVFGSVAGIILIGCVILMIWYKRRAHAQDQPLDDTTHGQAQGPAVLQVSPDVEPLPYIPKSTGAGASADAAAEHEYEQAVALEDLAYMYTTNV